MKNKTELIHDISEHVLLENYLDNDDWQSMSLIVDLEENQYAENVLLYLANETKYLSIDFNGQLKKMLNDLCEIIAVEVNVNAIQALLQVNSDDKKIKLNFEFYNRERWSVTGDNIEEKKKELRLSSDEA